MADLNVHLEQERAAIYAACKAGAATVLKPPSGISLRPTGTFLFPDKSCTLPQTRGEKSFPLDRSPPHTPCRLLPEYECRTLEEFLELSWIIQPCGDLRSDPEPNDPFSPTPRLNQPFPADHRIKTIGGDTPKKGWTPETAGVPVTDSVEMAGGGIGVGGVVRDIGPEDAKNDGTLTESGDANGTPSRDPNP